MRARTDLAGNVQERYTSLPFGDLLTTWNDNWQPTSPEVGAISPLHFTGKPRDAETGLDDFGARLYSSSLGRWMTPDWSAKTEPVPYAKLDNPQSLNFYTYVLNNPVTSVDKDGHWPNLDDVADFVAAFENAYTSDNAFGAGRQNQSTDAGQLGAGAGDVAAAVQGAAETIAGTGMEGSGLALDATGAGALVGVPAGAVGVAIISHGAATAGAGIIHLAKAGGGPKASAAPGVTANGQATDEYGNKLGPSGRPQINETNSNTREAARNKALNEGSGAVEHSNPLEGQPHFHPTDSQGEKKPCSAHHNFPC